ncbi:hypothetical protein IFM89_020699 [Coptis chinensis]|uniref:NAC domain-containing protein n=1 Tax=Coptis chinensis TaxID=261450 RepID=A0A835H5C6_9MAGN|nr:hypothetical protein IFM89_020699 [Coptis chinensis]
MIYYLRNSYAYGGGLDGIMKNIIVTKDLYGSEEPAEIFNGSSATEMYFLTVIKKKYGGTNVDRTVSDKGRWKMQGRGKIKGGVRDAAIYDPQDKSLIIGYMKTLNFLCACSSSDIFEKNTRKRVREDNDPLPYTPNQGFPIRLQFTDYTDDSSSRLHPLICTPHDDGKVESGGAVSVPTDVEMFSSPDTLINLDELLASLEDEPKSPSDLLAQASSTQLCANNNNDDKFGLEEFSNKLESELLEEEEDNDAGEADLKEFSSKLESELLQEEKDIINDGMEKLAEECIVESSADSLGVLSEEAKRHFSLVLPVDVYNFKLIQGRGEAVLALFPRVLAEGGICPNNATFATVLRVCSGENLSFHYVDQIHAMIIHYGFETDPIVCNPLIDLYSESGGISLMQSIFEKLSPHNNIFLGSYDLCIYPLAILNLGQPDDWDGLPTTKWRKAAAYSTSVLIFVFISLYSNGAGLLTGVIESLHWKSSWSAGLKQSVWVGINGNKSHEKKQVSKVSTIAMFKQFILHDFDASDGASSFPVAAVHRAGILDINQNLLVRKLHGVWGVWSVRANSYRWSMAVIKVAI